MSSKQSSRTTVKDTSEIDFSSPTESGISTSYDSSVNPKSSSSSKSSFSKSSISLESIEDEATNQFKKPLHENSSLQNKSIENEMTGSQPDLFMNGENAGNSSTPIWNAKNTDEISKSLSQPRLLCHQVEPITSNSSVPKFHFPSSSSSDEDKRKKTNILSIIPDLPDSLQLPDWCNELDGESQEASNKEKDNSLTAIEDARKNSEKVEENEENDIEIEDEESFDHTGSSDIPIKSVESKVCSARETPSIVSDSEEESENENCSNQQSASESQPPLRFELSQGFSQQNDVQMSQVFDKPEETPSKEPPTDERSINEPITNGSDANHKYEQKVKKLFLDFKEKLDELQGSSDSRFNHDFKVENRGKKIVITLEREDSSSIADFHQQSSSKSNDSDYPLNVGDRCFGYWGEYYYPGFIDSIDQTRKMCKVQFDDGSHTKSPFKKVIHQKLLKVNQKIRVRFSDGFYYDAAIQSISRTEDQITYIVRADEEEEVRCVPFSELGLSEEQRQAILPYTEIILEKSDMREKRALKRELELSIGCSSTGSEVDISPKRKIRRTQVEDVKLFTDYTFFITDDDTVDPYGILDVSSEENSDDMMDIAEISQMIKDHDGRILSRLNEREIRRSKYIICIARKPLITHTYIYCVVVGIPILHHSWILDSVEAKTRLKLDRYQLPAGKDITGEDVAQISTPFPTKKRDPNTPLCALRIYFHQGKKKDGNRELDVILNCAGCERVSPQTSVSKKTKKIPFRFDDVDYICTLTNRIPSILWNAAQENNVLVVTADWLIQCLITNQLLDAADSPIFTYKHKKAGNSSQSQTDDQKE